MTVQIVEIAGQKMAILPVADYERLADLAEDRIDAIAAADAETRRAGGEAYLPSDAVDRILAGGSALREWRQFRGFTQGAVADQAGCSKMAISHLERGSSNGSTDLWRTLAAILSVSVDDILPANAR